MKTKCIIVDDEPLAIELVKSHVLAMPRLQLVGTCINALEAAEIMSQQPIDLLFMDIQMPKITGIEFLKSVTHPPKVILTTAYREYALEGFELNVVDYLLKPITFERFFKAVNKYFELTSTSIPVTKEIPTISASELEHIYVNINKKNVKVLFKDVLYIESLKDYIKIVTEKENLVTKDKISDFEQKTPSFFLRIHRSFIVNTRNITAFTSNDVEMGGKEIPIGVSYKSEVFKILEKM